MIENRESKIDRIENLALGVFFVVFLLIFFSSFIYSLISIFDSLPNFALQNLAEREGFEPPRRVLARLTDFESVAFNRTQPPLLTGAGHKTRLSIIACFEKLSTLPERTPAGGLTGKDPRSQA